MESTTLLHWGLLGTDSAGSLRRTRTLDLGSAVRRFNDLAVPGMGNVWYAKQIYLAALGIAVSENVRHEKSVKNIETTNAIEAIACFLSFEKTGWTPDRRLKGINNLRGTNEVSFTKVRKPGFYVTQPMRMGVVQLLPALNLVNNDTTRFNSFELTIEGQTFVKRISEKHLNTYKSLGLVEHLTSWVKGSMPDSGVKNSEKLYNAISPLEKLDSTSRSMIKSILLKQGDPWSAARRKAILTWVDMPEVEKRGNWNWNKRPSVIDEEHWRDMEAGARFFEAQNLALELLDNLEIIISRKASYKISLSQANKDLEKAQKKLDQAANTFLKLGYDPSPEKEATKFCLECTNPAIRIKRLVERDGLGLCFKGEMITPGTAFKGDLLSSRNTDETEENEIPISDSPKLPLNISKRVHNMFYLNQDLKGGLYKWL